MYTPNLGSMLLFNLDYQAHHTCGDIATFLAIALGLNLGNLQPLDDERRITLRILIVVGMVLKKQGVYLFIFLEGSPLLSLTIYSL
jgi:hypothetical protein